MNKNNYDYLFKFILIGDSSTCVVTQTWGNRAC